MPKQFNTTELLVERHAFDSHLRALDALQLAVALEVRNQQLVDHFVAADGILCEVAGLEGVFGSQSGTFLTPRRCCTAYVNARSARSPS